MGLEPLCGLLGSRPVRTVRLPGELRAEGFDSTTGEFVSVPSLLITLYDEYRRGDDVDFTPMSKEEFDEYVENLRKNLGFDASDSSDLSFPK